MNRRTNVYRLEVPAHVPGLLQAMVETSDEIPGVERVGYSRQKDRAVLMFRTDGDASAIAAAEQMGGNTIGSRLYSGLGVHKRLVAES